MESPAAADEVGIETAAHWLTIKTVISHSYQLLCSNLTTITYLFTSALDANSRKAQAVDG